jgi:hypothetical protein
MDFLRFFKNDIQITGFKAPEPPVQPEVKKVVKKSAPKKLFRPGFETWRDVRRKMEPKLKNQQEFLIQAILDSKEEK